MGPTVQGGSWVMVPMAVGLMSLASGIPFSQELSLLQQILQEGFTAYGRGWHEESLERGDWAGD